MLLRLIQISFGWVVQKFQEEFTLAENLPFSKTALISWSFRMLGYTDAKKPLISPFSLSVFSTYNSMIPSLFPYAWSFSKSFSRATSACGKFSRLGKVATYYFESLGTFPTATVYAFSGILTVPPILKPASKVYPIPSAFKFLTVKRKGTRYPPSILATISA